LKSGDTDYLVPTTSSFIPIALPGAGHAYFISLVSSTIYTTALTPVSDKISFSIYVSPKKNPTNAGVALAGKSLPSGSVLACTGCSNQQTTLGTLYQEYDINPFNKTIVSVLPTLTRAIADTIENTSGQDTAVYGGISKQHLQAIAVYMASTVVSSLQAAGLTPELIKASQKELTNASSVKAIAIELAKRLAAALRAANLTGPQLKGASPKSIETALQSPAARKVFDGLGSSLKKAIPARLTPIFDGLGGSLGSMPDWSTYAVQLAQGGLIPLGALYIYFNVPLGGGLGADTYSAKVKEAFPTLNSSIITAHGRWKRWKMGQTENLWQLYAAMGPFAFTTKLLPNIVIEGISIEAFKAGDYVYQSDTYEGDILIVARTLSKTFSTGSSSTEAFDPANPQPYLISLISGKIYQRQADTGMVSLVTTSDGKEAKLANLNAIRQGIKDADLKQKIQAQETDTTWGVWHRYGFGTKVLTINPTDARNGAYVYMDVTDIKDYDAWTNESVSKRLSAVEDFLVPVKDSGVGKPVVGVPIEGNPQYVISLVNGAAYDATGPTASPLTDVLNGETPMTYLKQNLGATIRGPMLSRIEALIKTQETLSPAEPAKEPTLPTLSSGTATKLLSESTPYLPHPYKKLKKMGSKYYGVSTDPNVPEASIILDYGQTFTETIYEDGKETQRTRPVAVSFVQDPTSKETRIISVYDGFLLDGMRNTAGVVVKNGAQTLGVPRNDTPLEMIDPTKQLISYEPAKKAKIGADASFYPGNYEVFSYENSNTPSLGVVAKYTPLEDQTTYRYVDLYGGVIYNADGSAHQIDYPVLIEPKSSKVIPPAKGVKGAKPRTLSQPETTLALLGTWGKDGNYRAFGAGTDNYYYAWSLVPAPKAKATNWRNLVYKRKPFDKDNLPLFNFWAVGNHTRFLAIGSTGPKPLSKDRASLDATYPVVTIRGGVKDAKKCKANAGGGPTGSCAPSFTLVTHTYSTKTAGKSRIRVYDYLGSDSSTGTPVFNATKHEWNPNYAGAQLFVVGTGAGKSWDPTRLYLTSSSSDPALKKVQMPLGSFVEFTSTNGSNFTASPLPKGKKLTMKVTFFKNLNDANTKAHYVAVRDGAGTHYYIPEYERVDGRTVKAIENAIGAYVTMTSHGDVGLTRQMPKAINLNPVEAILSVPTNEVDAMKTVQSNGKFVSYTFKTADGKDGPPSYFYVFDTTDEGKAYEQPKNVAYADLRLGMLYDTNGKPIGRALYFTEIDMILSDHKVKLPSIDDDPSTYKPSEGYAIVPSGTTLSKSTPFLWYGGS